MKQVLLILFIVLFSKSIFGQIALAPSPKHFVLIGIRSDPIMWNEIGYMYLGKKYLNFQIKGSFVKDFGYINNPSYVIYIGPVTNVNFISSFYFVKPGYILLKRESITNTFLLVVNGLFSLSKDQLIVNFKDPLLGNVQQITKENHFYNAIDLEMKWHLDLNKFFALSLSGLVGYNLSSNNNLFKDVYHGAFSNRETYYPGVGFYFEDAYFLLNMGLAIKPF